MGGTQAGSTMQGNQADDMLGTSEGWDAFGVVRWHRVTLAWAGSLEVAVPYPEEMNRELRRAAIWPDGSSSA